MKYLGDLTEDQTIDFKFSTHKADGTPITLAGTPAVKIYKANATDSETATGVTLSVDFDGVTGLHNVRIDTSADAFYATGNDYSVVITTGTVDSVSVVGTVLATFSIENRFIEADLAKILGTALTETAGGYLAAAFKKLFDVETPTGTINSLPAAIPGAAGGLFIAGTNAPVTISGSGNALTLTSTGANGHGLAATGNGNGNGITATGGATGDGAAMEGGATNGFGLNVAGNGDHAGVRVAGEGTGAGLQVSGGTTGNGITISGGSSSGSGVYITTPGAGPYGLAVFGGSNGSAILAAGQGAGHGLSVAGGATGHGLSALGGSTSGDGMHLEGRTLGHGLYAIGVGASRYDIDADIHGTIDTCTTNTDMRGTDGAALPGDKMDLLDTIVEDAP